MDSVSFFSSLLKMLFSLSLVLGMLIGAMYLFRRILQHTTARSNGDQSAINIIAARYIGPKSSIMLVEVLGNIIVVGISANQMSPLATISDPGIMEKLKFTERQAKTTAPLAGYLKQNRVAQRIIDGLIKDRTKS